MTSDPTPRAYRVVHATQYQYDDDVSVSYGRAHLLPRALPGQVVMDSDLAVDPSADELRSHVDFYGNISTYYVVRRSHRALRVTATSDVRVDRQPTAADALDEFTWEAARDLLTADIDAREFVLASPLVRPLSVVSEYASASFSSGRSLGAALVELTGRIHADFKYMPGTTSVRAELSEVLEGRQGVCQDFAHLLIACLRSVGLPARYVSGYLETDPPPGQPKRQGADASHAWAALRVPGMEWVDIDPTNNQFVDGGYVVAGWGRDYGDVPPLSGVILTHANKSTMRVSVDVTRTS